jgi:ABC-type multidrug transport system ATPase subunit
MHLIRLTNVKKHYLNKIFDLEIHPHDFILVSGENGHGKTTLIQLVLGYIYPDQGQIDQKKLKIGFLPEKASLPLFVNVSKYLHTLAKIKKTTMDHELLYDFHVPLSKSIHELSKGNMQKLALVSTFLGKPDLIILDEPLSGLDQESIKVLETYITKRRLEGMSFLISTHQPERFLHLCNKHLVL